MKQWRRLVLTLLPVFVVAFAAAPSAGTTSDASFDRVQVEGGGISVEYPARWTVMPRTKAELRRQQRALQKEDPRLAQLLADSAQLDLQPTTVKARVLDLRGYLLGQYTGGIRVYVHTDGPLPATLAEYTSRFVLVEDLANATLVNATTKTIDGRKVGYRVDLRRPIEGTSGDMRITWLTIPRAGGDVSVHLTVLGTTDESFIDRIVVGVHLK